MRILCALLALLAAEGIAAAESFSDCLPKGTASIRARIGSSPPVAARLEGGIETPLMLFDAASGNLLWSAAEHGAAIQQVPGLDAPITGSLTAIDLDGDGLHDRIYAGDMAGRLWRLDLRHGAAATEWTAAVVFADFNNDDGRGFIAAPDVSLSAPPGLPPWLNIALGTAAPGNPGANNRLYVLRDPSVRATQSLAEDSSRRAIRESDLRRLQTVRADAAEPPDPDSHGWYIELGTGHVIVPTLTVEHRAVLVIASAVPGGSACEVFVRIAELDLLQQQVVPITANGEWSTALPAPVPAAAGLEIAKVEAGIAECTLADHRVPACDVDTRPRKTWWRRTDAE